MNFTGDLNRQDFEDEPRKMSDFDSAYRHSKPDWLPENVTCEHPERGLIKLQSSLAALI